MPCSSGPTIGRNYDPVAQERMIEQLRLADVERKKIEKEKLKKEKEEVDKELKEGNLENMAFNSFMSVFLCRAMDIVVSNFGYKFIPPDLEWWYKEHKYRDNHQDKSSLTKEEITTKMIEFSRQFQVK